MVILLTITSKTMKIINFFKSYFASSNIDQVMTGGIILIASLIVIFAILILINYLIFDTWYGFAIIGILLLIFLISTAISGYIALPNKIMFSMNIAMNIFIISGSISIMLILIGFGIYAYEEL